MYVCISTHKKDLKILIQRIRIPIIREYIGVTSDVKVCNERRDELNYSLCKFTYKDQEWNFKITYQEVVIKFLDIL